MSAELIQTLRTMRHGQVKNYATPGLSSWLVGGKDHGKVRLFKADRDTRDWAIAPHSHRFDFTCLVLAGTVTNVIFEDAADGNVIFEDAADGNAYARGVLAVPNGGLGKYEFTPGDTPSFYQRVEQVYIPGDFYSMEAEQIHTIYFSKGAVVLFFEGPERAYHSVVLEPWSDGRRIPTFKVEPWMFDSQP